MTQAQLANAVATAVAAALAGKGAKSQTRRGKTKTKKAKGRGEKLTEAEKATFMAQNDAKCVTAFEKAGHKDVKPRVNVLTYNKWVEQGRMVRKGEKSVKVGPFALFHIDQTDLILTPPATVTAESETANQVAA